MAVPDFQKMMLPYLEFLWDGNERTSKELVEHMVQHFDLTQEDRDEVLPSGSNRRLTNRVGWARAHLKGAGLILAVRRGVVQVTNRGKELLSSPPKRLDIKFLDATYKEHYAWAHPKHDSIDFVYTDPGPGPTEISLSELPSIFGTPEEQLDGLVNTLDAQLADELLIQVKAMDPFRFEHLVVDLLLAMGYGGSRKAAGQVTKKSNDEGIDGIINQDRLGVNKIYIQAKRWDKPVGRTEIQKFVGALAGKQATKGIFITTDRFVDTAQKYADGVQHNIVLIDGNGLTELMIEYGIGVSLATSYVVKRVDSDYFVDA